MRPILVIATILSILAAAMVPMAGAHDGKQCEKRVFVLKDDEDSCDVHFYWDGEGLDLKALEGLQVLHGLEELKALDKLDIAIDVDRLDKTLDELYKSLDSVKVSDLDLDGLHESLRDLRLHIPPECILNLPLPPAAGIHFPHVPWDCGRDFRTDEDSLSDQEQLRLEALRALARLDGREALPALEKILKEDKRPAVRGRALNILRWIDDRQVVPILGDVAKNDPDARIRKRAIACLGQSGDKRALDVLRRILEE